MQPFNVAQNGLIDFEDTHIKESVPEIPRGASTSLAGGAVPLEWYGDGLPDTSLKVIHGPDWQHAPLQIPLDRPRRCQPGGDLSLNESGHTHSHTSPSSVSNVSNCKRKYGRACRRWTTKQNRWTDTHSRVSNICGATNTTSYVEHSQKGQELQYKLWCFCHIIYMSMSFQQFTNSSVILTQMEH